MMRLHVLLNRSKDIFLGVLSGISSFLDSFSKGTWWKIKVEIFQLLGKLAAEEG